MEAPGSLDMLQVETHVVEKPSPTDRLTWGLWGYAAAERSGWIPVSEGGPCLWPEPGLV